MAPVTSHRQPERLRPPPGARLEGAWVADHLGVAGRAAPTAAERVRVPSQIKYVLQTMLQPRGARLKQKHVLDLAGHSDPLSDAVGVALRYISS